jgi:hypothetical protein
MNCGQTGGKNNDDTTLVGFLGGWGVLVELGC